MLGPCFGERYENNNNNKSFQILLLRKFRVSYWHPPNGNLFSHATTTTIHSIFKISTHLLSQFFYLSTHLVPLDLLVVSFPIPIFSTALPYSTHSARYWVIPSARYCTVLSTCHICHQLLRYSHPRSHTSPS